jgi:adenine-specific DNA-methyltransferase
VIKYLGSKRVLLPRLLELVAAISGPCTVLDLFSGTSRVGHALKRAGYRVIANDHNAYAHALGTCYVQADASRWLRETRMLVDEFNALPGRAGYFTTTFCEEARFFMPRNGARVDAIREAIARKGLPRELEAIMLVSLMEAADRVDSTTGLQMAYLKQWAPRAHNDLTLRAPELLERPASGACEAHALDAAEAASMPADLAYVDPPYNQHSYLGNYHVWETLVRWDAPAAYGVARKREDCRTRKSPFNAKRTFESALRTTLKTLRAPRAVISFSDEGFITREAMESLIVESMGPGTRVRVHDVAHRRYVGAQIGIHNPAGDKVGVVSHLVNREFFFVADRTGEGVSVSGDGDGREDRRRQEGTRPRRAKARPGR